MQSMVNGRQSMVKAPPTVNLVMRLWPILGSTITIDYGPWTIDYGLSIANSLVRTIPASFCIRSLIERHLGVKKFF